MFTFIDDYNNFNLQPFLLFNSPRWWCPRSWSTDGSSGPPKANATWQSPSKRAGVPHSSVYLPPDFLSHSAGHLNAPDGWHDGGRWPHSSRGEVPSNFINVFCLLYSCPAFYQSVNGKKLPFLPSFSGIHTRRSSQRCEPSPECLPRCQQCFPLR